MTHRSVFPLVCLLVAAAVACEASRSRTWLLPNGLELSGAASLLRP